MSEENTNQNQEQNNQPTVEELLKNEALKEHINKLITEKVEAETTGLKANRDLILKEKKELEDKVKKDLAASGNIDELSARIRTERDTEWTSKFDPLKSENENLKNQLNEIKQHQKSSKLNDMALKELTGFSIHPASIEDAQEKFRTSFDIDENGNITHKANKLNDQGKPFTAVDFYNELQKTKPHWFNGVSGTGTKPSPSNPQGSKEIDAAAMEKMSGAEYRDAKRKGLIK